MRFKQFGKVTRDAVVVAGEFDPLTYEHLDLFKRMAAHAKEKNLSPVVVLFYPRPIDFVMQKPHSVYYNSTDFIIEKIRECGIEAVLMAKFTSKDAASDALTFFPKLATRLRFREFWIGNGQSFGKGKGGTPEAIFSMQDQLGFTASIIEDVRKRANAKVILSDLENGGFRYSNRELPYRPTWKRNKDGYITCNWKDGKYTVCIQPLHDNESRRQKIKFETEATRISDGLVKIDLPPGEYEYFSIIGSPGKTLTA